MLKEQLFFFTGKNEYALAEELRRWKMSFLEKHGEANMSVLAAEKTSWQAVLEEGASAPFLSEKRLVVVEGIGAGWKKEHLEMLIGQLHPQTLLVFVDALPDQRKGTTKFLLKESTVKMFPLLTPKQLVIWLQTIAKEYHMELPQNVAAHLIAVTGTNQWCLQHECRKLLSYVNETPTLEDVDHMCLPDEKQTIWKLSDLIGQGRTTESVQFVRKLHAGGEDAFALWNIYLWILKNLAGIWFLRQEKKLSANAISKEAAVPFLSVQALLPYADRTDTQTMQAVFQRAVQTDTALKTGILKSTAEEPVELLTALERCIVAMG